MKGMATLSASGWAIAAHHAGMERLHGGIGESHELQARRYPEGSRQHEFHTAVSNAHYATADKQFRYKYKTVAKRAERISSKLSRTSSDEGRTGKPEMSNRSGKFN